MEHLVLRKSWRLQVDRTGYHANDAYTAWLEMGSPENLTKAQVAHLNELTRDLPVTDRTVRSNRHGDVDVRIPMNSNDVVLVTLRPAND